MTTRSRPRIVVTGATGQVGWELLRSLQGLGEIIGVDRTVVDLSQLGAVRALVRSIEPSIVVNAAAYTAVDKAEQEREAAFLLNADLPGVLAEECKRAQAAFIHYSTDYVFDGRKEGAYTEGDATNPLNVYGASKLAGEHNALGANPATFVFRTSWVYATRGKNFLLTIQRLAKERSQLRIVSDQVGAPTWSRSIADLTAHILSQGLGSMQADPAWWTTHGGIYHLTSSGSTSWHGFAQAILERAGIVGVAVEPIPAVEYPTPAARPSNSRLALDKLQSVFGLVPECWEQSLTKCLASTSAERIHAN
ncbi:dTDP-4-dehydrorhamnose reductase [Ralstonia mannitolilytica]|uniref:dTDP-4-dehydrorhamnose reductase n=1 Tax=Ralstonia mannitolilytica TaxID=105219 RepID=UPI0028F6ABAB|nr:dTDP-4-dehydrorhamnose reductase [Ralstonia mannitolilytica]CAJ0777097.1 dTDP-4-dehydrorhamnose reductase [Ralstonia mannitolilytica]